MEKMESHFFSNHLVVITVHFHFIAMTFGMFKKKEKYTKLQQQHFHDCGP